MQHIIALHPELKALLDRMVTHLCQQRSRCVSYDNICSYRGVDGAMCAVGALIPDELYAEDIEGSVAGNDTCAAATEHLKSLAPSIRECELAEFLELIQTYHDRTADSAHAIRHEFSAADQHNYITDLQGPAETLRERMLASIEVLIAGYLRHYPSNCVGWFA